MVMDGVKVALGSRGMTLEAACHFVKDRKEWRALVQMSMIEFQVAIFAWLVSSFGPPSRALVSYRLERGWDTVT